MKTPVPHLLPPNSTPLERSLAQVGAQIENNDTSLIVQVTRADAAPAAFLPYLAWEVSVDRWSDSWPEDVKRQVIAESFYVHKRKGTIASLRRVIEPFGKILRITEWFEHNPPGPRGTFSLDIGVTGQGISESLYHELERMISETKPLSRHLLHLNMTAVATGTLWLASASYTGEITAVYPPHTRSVTVQGWVHTTGAVHLIDTLQVEYQT